MDRSGLVVIHRDFVRTPPMTRQHVTQVEPSVAADMVNTVTLSRDSCVSYEDITNQLFWTVDTSTVCLPRQQEKHTIQR